MKVLFMCKNYSDMYKVIETDNVPRIGENVNLFFKPAPKVVNVLWYPEKKHGEPDVTILLE